MKRQEVSDAPNPDYQLYYDCQNVRVDRERKSSSKPLTLINKKHFAREQKMFLQPFEFVVAKGLNCGRRAYFHSKHTFLQDFHLHLDRNI